VLFCCCVVRRVPPHFSIPPENAEVLPGGAVNLTCVAIGSPMPFVRWRLGAVELTPEDNPPIGKNILQLTDVRETVWVSETTSRTPSDLKNTLPTSRTFYSWQTCERRCECQTTSRTSSDLKNIVRPQEHSSDLKNIIRPQEHSSNHKDILQLTDVRETASYTCVATSDLGNIEYDAEVRVKGTASLGTDRLLLFVFVFVFVACLRNNNNTPRLNNINNRAP